MVILKAHLVPMSLFRLISEKVLKDIIVCTEHTHTQYIHECCICIVQGIIAFHIWFKCLEASDKLNTHTVLLSFLLTHMYTTVCVGAHTQFTCSVCSEKLDETEFVTHSLTALLIPKGRNRV